MMIKNRAPTVRACALIAIVAFSFLSPAGAAINVDGVGTDWKPGYFQIQDGANDIGASYDSGYEITRIWLYYEADKLYMRMDVKGLPGDADGDGNIDTEHPTDQPGVGTNEIYRFRIDKNKDGVWDITIEYFNNALATVGVAQSKVAFAYDDVVEASISDLSSLGIDPFSFRIYAYAGTGLDGLPEDVVPATDVNLSPQLSIQKIVDKPESSPGDVLTYTISYSNDGYSDASNARISDNVPANTSYVSGGTLSGNTVTWNLGSLEVGQSGSVTLKVRVNSPLNDETVIRNVAMIESDQTTPKTTQAETIVHSAPILSIGKTDSPDPVPANSNLTYTISYSNTGDMNATNVIIHETYPQNVTFVSSVPAPTSGNDEWHMGTLEAGASGSIVVTVKVGNVSQGTTLTNRATIDSDQTETEDTTTTTTVSSVILLIQKTDAPDPVNAGQNMTYTILYSNTGNAGATNVVITENYDPNVTFISSSPQPDSGTNKIFTIGNLAAGASGTITIVSKVSPSAQDGSVITNTAIIDSNEVEPASATATTTVLSRPLLSITKDVDKSNARAGETLIYAIKIRNDGTAAATGVTVSDAVPQQVSLVPGSVSENGSGISTIVWNIGTLAPSQSKSVGFSVKIGGDFSGIIQNIAILDSDQTDPASDDALTSVSNEEVIDILLSPPYQKKYVKRCEIAVYPITVSNRGSMADTVSLVFTEPPKGWSASLDKNEVSLDPGASTIVYLKVWACLDTGQATVGVTGKSGNDASVTSSVSTLTVINNGGGNPSGASNAGNPVLNMARQNLIITNIKSGEIFFLKNSMAVNTIELGGDSISLVVDVKNRGMRTAHDVTLDFGGLNAKIDVQPPKQDIAGGKTKSFSVSLNFLEIPQSLSVFADGREDDSGTYKLKIKPVPQEQIEPAPTYTPQTPSPTKPPATLQPAPTFQPAPTSQPSEEKPAPTTVPQPSYMQRLKKKTSDYSRVGIANARRIAPYAGGAFLVACLCAIVYAARRRILDAISSVFITLKRIRVPRMPQRRPRPQHPRPARSSPGIPGRKHKFVLETDGL